jgi:hypothetical protein
VHDEVALIRMVAAELRGELARLLLEPGFLGLRPPADPVAAIDRCGLRLAFGDEQALELEALADDREVEATGGGARRLRVVEVDVRVRLALRAVDRVVEQDNCLACKPIAERDAIGERAGDRIPASR